MQISSSLQESAQQSQHKLEKAYFQQQQNQPALTAVQDHQATKIKLQSSDNRLIAGKQETPSSQNLFMKQSTNNSLEDAKNGKTTLSLKTQDLPITDKRQILQNKNRQSNSKLSQQGTSQTPSKKAAVFAEMEKESTNVQQRNQRTQSRTQNINQHFVQKQQDESFSQSGSLGFLSKETPGYANHQFRQSSFSSQQNHRKTKINNQEVVDNQNIQKSAQHMKFIQNYSEHYQQDASPQTANLMSFQVKKQNQNTIQQEDHDHTPGKPHKNRSKNFFKLDRGFGETSSSNGVGSHFVPKSQMVAHTSPYVVNSNIQKQEIAEFQMSKQRQLNASKQMQAQDQKKLSSYQQFKINENINFQQFSTYLSNFVNSEKYLKLQEKFSDSGKASKALILTPWSEKQTESEKMKQLSQFMQMSQVSQNGLRLNPQSQDGHNKANSQKQQAMFQSQLKNILQKIIGGSRNEQFLQQSSNLFKMGLSPEMSNLTEEQVWTILGNYFKEQMPSPQIRSASSQHNSSYAHKAPTSDTINASIMTDESVLTKEQKRYLKKQKKQMSQINEQSERRTVQVKEKKAQSRERFCISGQSGDNMRPVDNKQEVHSIATPGLSMFGQPQASVGQSPANQTQQQPPSQNFVNRQKFVKKFQNNIHIIDDAESKRSPYDGLFNLNGKQISQTQSAMRDDGGLKVDGYKHKEEKLQHQHQQIKMKEHTSTIDHSQVQNKGNYKNTVRSKAELQQEPATPAPAAQAGSAHYKMAQQSSKTVERRGAATEKRQNPATTDFDIEYAKLIAKQFPIYDQKGKLIDYSNINEFQLELLALHEEYGEEKDPKVKMRIFQQLSSINEEEFYEKKRQAKLKAEQNKHHHERAGGDNQGQDDTQKGFLKKGIFTKKPYGKNVGKDGGNPEYRKTVIQLENERIERERQEILVKRKRNSNYIQQCIKHGNEHYDQQKLNGLSWLKKPKAQDEEEKASIQSKLDEKNLELLRKKQEILAKYNQFSKQNAPQFADDGLCRVSFVKGNNSKLVKQVLLTRDHWAELEQQHNTLYQFKWAPVSRYINFEQLGAHGQKKIVNHIEKHELLTTKDQIYTNMHRFCEHEKLNVFQYLPIQFVVDLSAKNCLQEIDKFCQFFNSIERVKKQSAVPIDEQIPQINQHIAQNKAIQAESKYKGMINRKFDLDEQMYQGGNVWLIKPNDFNRGRGVKLFNTLEQLRKLMKEFSNGNEMDFYFHNVCCQILANEKALNNLCKGGDDAVLKEQVIEPQIENDKKERAENFLTAGVTSDVFVIQKYIEKPLLIDQRKFDIRLWVLVDCCDLKDQKCYLFKEGYIRTSCHQFTLSQESIDQPFIHLTNNAVQQYDENYGKHEEGNQLTFEKASSIIRDQTGKDVDFYELLNGRILDIIKMTFRCVDNHKLNPNQKKHQFEIFGYDFMVDSDLRPWLIEINTNPCLEETSKLLSCLLPRMLNDAFKLTLDVWFPRPNKHESDTIQQGQKQTGAAQPYPVEKHSDSEIMWKHIYTLKPQ